MFYGRSQTPNVNNRPKSDRWSFDQDRPALVLVPFWDQPQPRDHHFRRAPRVPRINSRTRLRLTRLNRFSATNYQRLSPERSPASIDAAGNKFVVSKFFSRPRSHRSNLILQTNCGLSHDPTDRNTARELRQSTQPGWRSKTAGTACPEIFPGNRRPPKILRTDRPTHPHQSDRITQFIDRPPLPNSIRVYCDSDSDDSELAGSPSRSLHTLATAVEYKREKIRRIFPPTSPLTNCRSHPKSAPS